MNIEELKELFGVRTDEELASKFDLKGGAVSNWRTTGKIPSKILAKTAQLVDNVEVTFNSDGSVNLKKLENKLRPQDAFDIPPPTRRIPVIS